MALSHDQRPLDHHPVHTADLPATPTRDRTIVATAWLEAPEAVLGAGRDLGHEQVDFLRRIGPWLLWRSGPATHGDARYLAIRADDLAVHHSFRLLPDGTGEGVGPSGERHARFRTWKEDLRDAGLAAPLTDPVL